ncbi:hypothetical protein HO133_004159 [Letharia lupina]|uniref:LysM domain-containing protein n=1 Tax=Letharia lupina TaxID=560253 RepID=A0A8H6C9U9_9LECA|nr:uncharacterized protein HO133_004159 [Letharia lupina]KAF6219690.1 hypothetical protein HO133_004159 [Letharia lupina]
MLDNIPYTRFLVFTSYAAAFSLYPTVNPDSLAKSFGISVGCLDALNETVACDQTLFQMSNTVDSYLWTTENVTGLCTADCIQSSQKWWLDVQDRCDMDTITAYGKLIPAESIAGRFFDGLNIACLRSGTIPTAPGVAGNGSSNSTGSAPYSNSSASFTGSGPYLNSSSKSNPNSSALSWCLIESQGWVGSDIIRPDCSTDPTDPSCSDPTDVAPQNERIANLYGNDMLCSDCFLRMFYQRMSSPYLPDSDYSDYLVAQYQDILDVCRISMPELMVRALPYYEDAPGLYDGVPLSSDNSLMPPFTSNGSQFSNGTNIPANGTWCNALSAKYSVATGDLQAAIGDPGCVFLVSSYCVPAACTLMKVPFGASCFSDSIASSLSTAGLNTSPVSTVQFRNWNPNINGLCDNLNTGDYVCTSAPGGSYVPPPVSNTNSNASALQRGGGDGSDTGAPSNPTAPFSNSTLPTNTVVSPSSGSSGSGSAAPSPTQKGISASCAKYSQAKKGDYCSTFAQEHNIASAQFYALNSALGDAGKSCDAAFWSGYYYCVGSSDASAAGGNNPTSVTTALSAIDAAPVTTTTTSDSAPTPATGGDPATPSPTQSGIASPCAKYAQAHAGDTCSSFATANQITPADLYSRNGALGENGENCETKFWAGYFYCVGGTD